MSAPSAFVWDSGNINVGTISPTHQTAGYAGNEVPTSAEFNAILVLIAAWIAYLNTAEAADAAAIAALKASRARKIPPSAGTQVGGTPGVTHWTNNGQWIASTSSDQLAIPIVVEQGEKITSIAAYVSCGPTDVMKLLVFKQPDAVGSGAGTGASQLGSTQTSAGHSNLVEALTVSGLTELVDGTQTQYVAIIECTAFASVPVLCGIVVTTMIP